MGKGEKAGYQHFLHHFQQCFNSLPNDNWGISIHQESWLWQMGAKLALYRHEDILTNFYKYSNRIETFWKKEKMLFYQYYLLFHQCLQKSFCSGFLKTHGCMVKV